MLEEEELKNAVLVVLASKFWAIILCGSYRRQMRFNQFYLNLLSR